MNFTTTMILFIGGILGTFLRYKILEIPYFIADIRMNTIIINVIGCFMAGFFFAVIKRYNLSPQHELFLIIGFCGAFTTLSAYMLDAVLLILKNDWLLAFASISLNTFLSLAAIWLGLTLAMYMIG